MVKRIKNERYPPSSIARQHPETWERIVEVLRARLPRVDEDGDFVIPPLYDEDKVLLRCCGK